MIYDVVIVGAGICGLTAALELKRRGVMNILILEADDRIGGRARSMTLPDGQTINEGANWFHGGDDNPFFQWARERYDLGPMTLDDNGEGKGGEVIWKSGSLEEMVKIFQDIEKAYLGMSERQREKASMLDVATAMDSPKAAQIIDFMAAGWMAVDGAAQIAAGEYFEDPLGPGGWQMSDGIGLLIEQMAYSLQDDIRCNAIVTEVAHTQPGVTVVLSNAEKILAKTVLVTVSPAVLTSNAIGFGGPVKAVVEDKIRGIMMGNLAKVIVPVREDFFRKAGIGPDTPISMVDDHCFVHIRTADKNTITLFKGGKAGREIEYWTQDRLEAFAKEMLAKISLLKGWEEAKSGPVAVTGWGKNPFCLGSYTVCATGFTRPDPFACGPIFFSGEALLASSDDSPGQMAGAWAAGRKSAGQIAALVVE